MFIQGYAVKPPDDGMIKPQTVLLAHEFEYPTPEYPTPQPLKTNLPPCHRVQRSEVAANRRAVAANYRLKIA